MTSPQYSYSQQRRRHQLGQDSLSPESSRLTSVRNILRRNQELLRNAGSLAGTTGITSLLGFAYWIYAARVFSTGAVGYATAAISTMVLLGTIGMFGLDTMLMGELPRGGNRGGLAMASCITAFCVSFVLGLGFCFATMRFDTRFDAINRTPSHMLTFAFGAGMMGATLVFDAATIGLMRGGLQLWRNGAFSLAKVAALPAIAIFIHDRLGFGIVLSWIAGSVLSLIPTVIMIKRGDGTILHRPDWLNLWRRRKLALAHNWLNLAINIPGAINPVLVALVVSSSENGTYYIAALISSFLYMVPAALSTVLFAVASAAPEQISEKLRFVLRTSLAIQLPAVLVVSLGARYILLAFGSSYVAIGTTPLWLLAVATVPGLFNQPYIAVARAHGRFNQATIFLTASAVLRMAAILVGGKLAGLVGVSLAILAVQLASSFITVPSVLRTAFGSATARSAVDSAVAGRAQSAQLADSLRLRQEAGLAALIELATRAGPLRLGTETMGVDSPSRSPRTTARETGSGQHPYEGLTRPARRRPAVSDTDWWPDINEATFRSRQEAGMAALIAIATQPAKF